MGAQINVRKAEVESENRKVQCQKDKEVFLQIWICCPPDLGDIVFGDSSCLAEFGGEGSSFRS